MRQTAENTWIVKGMMPLFELEEAFEIEIPEEYVSNSLNGLLGEILGRLPHVGDYVDIDGIRIIVLKISHRRATELKVERFAPPAESGESK